MINRIKSCCVLDYSFTKYNNLEPAIITKLRKSFMDKLEEILQKEKCLKLISGMNRGFETLAAQITLEMKNKHQNITFECALPDELQAVGWSEGERELYYNILGKCDVEKFISKQQSKDNVRKRNKYMISSSKYIFVFSDNYNISSNSLIKSTDKEIYVFNTYK